MDINTSTEKKIVRLSKRGMGEGFPQEKIYVVPRNILKNSRSSPVLHALTVTDAGFFPVARYHARQREHGCSEHILLLCTGGRGLVEIDGCKFDVFPGQAIAIPPNVSHLYGADLDDPWTIYWFHVIGDFVPQYLPHNHMKKIVDVSSDKLPELQFLFERLFNSLSRGTSEPYMLTASTAAGLILARIYHDGSMSVEDSAKGSSRDVEELISFIQNNIEKPINLETLSQRSKLSTSRINQLFHKITGYAPIEFVRHQRIQRACYYLDATRESIGIISEWVGFEDQFHFSKVFHKIVGKSPREYRNRV